MCSNHNRRKRPRAARAVCGGLARLRSGVGSFTGGPRPRESLVLGLRLQRPPVHLPAPHAARPLRPASARAAGEPRAPATEGGGGPLLTFHAPGVHRGRSGQPQTRCLLRGASCETGRGCRAPQHPWVRRKNKPQHPLLSGLNNRWPLVVSFYQREGSKAAGLLFVASLESSLSRQRPRENKPAPGAPSRG